MLTIFSTSVNIFHTFLEICLEVPSSPLKCLASDTSLL
nr:MAG TPA: hypothetical protein [Caudoviricetes sp.]